MHHRPHISTAARRRTRRILALTCIGLALLATLHVLARSELVLRPVVDRLAEAAGERAAGTLTVGAIRPAGLVSVSLEDVRFTPDAGPATSRTAAMVRVAHARFTPRFSDLIRVRAGFGTITISGLEVTAIIGDDEAPHVDWLRERARLQSYPAPASETEVRDAGFDLGTAPTIRIEDATLTVDDVTGRLPGLGARVADARFVPPGPERPATLEGDLYIEGMGRSAFRGTFGQGQRALEILPHADEGALALDQLGGAAAEGATVTAASVSLDWPLRVRLSDVRTTGLDTALPALDHAAIGRLDADSVSVRLALDQLTATISGVRVGDRSDAIDEVVVTRPWRSGPMTVEGRVGDVEAGYAMFSATLDGARLHASARAQRMELSRLSGPLEAMGVQEPPSGKFTGTVAVRSEDARTFEADVTGAFESLSILAPRVSDAPLSDLHLDVNAHLIARPADGAFVMDRTRILLPATGAIVRGTAERGPEGWSIDLAMSQPRVDASHLLDALPSSLSDTLRDLEVRGPVAADVRFSADSRALESLALDVHFDTDALEVVSFGADAPIDRLGEPDFVWRREGTAGDGVGPGADTWVALDALPALTWRAVIAAEDDRFWTHQGFDVRGLLAALQENLRAGEIVRGGSTISQQVVKNLFLSDERTFGRKLQEAVLTWALEQTVPKEQILAWYLNLARWGPDVHGIGDASEAYFGHAAGQLTLRESVFLAAILPNPDLFGEQYARGALAPSRVVKMRNILANLQRAGFLSEETMTYHLALVERGEISASAPGDRIGGAAPPRVASVQPGLDTLLFR
jgi:hypothetical protein